MPHLPMATAVLALLVRNKQARLEYFSHMVRLYFSEVESKIWTLHL